ncbi:MAG: S1C family serine protease [Phycisphaeraceae bacterium]
MKHSTMTATMLLASLSLPAWAQGDPFDQPQPGEGWVRVEKPEQVRDQAPAATIEAAFLGVNAEPLDFDTAKLLGVPRGTGLLITFVAEDSPAAKAGLKQGDIVTKLGDQLLINPEQLAVLVRTHKAGDTITLHASREGEAMKLAAELVTRQLPDLGPGGRNLAQRWRVQLNPQEGPVGDPFAPEFELMPGVWLGDGWGLRAPGALDNEALPNEVKKMIEDLQVQMLQQRQEMDKMFQQMRLQLDLDLDDLQGQLDAPGGHATASASAMTFDGEHEIKITSKDGARHLTIKDKNGKVIFDGPMPDNGQVPGLDKAIQKKVDKLIVNTGIDIRNEPAPPADAPPAT